MTATVIVENKTFKIVCLYPPSVIEEFVNARCSKHERYSVDFYSSSDLRRIDVIR